MKTKITLIASALFLAVLGLLLSFLPQEVLFQLTGLRHQLLSVVLQLLGAVYLGFAMLNWMAKGSIIGGIYNRPIAIGNFMHFAVGAIALIKFQLATTESSIILLLLTIGYSLFALIYAYIFNTTPKQVLKD